MDPQTIFIIIIIILVFNYIMERALEYLNSRKFNDDLPGEIKDVYDHERYKKSQEYKKENYRFSIITSTFSFILILGMFLFDGFAYTDQVARSIFSHPVPVALIFFGILMFLFDLLLTPFTVYDTFVIEEKYGFNKTTVRTFILDKIKGWLLSAIIGGGLLAVIVWFYLKTTSNFWLYAWALISIFSIFMSMFYSNLIVPLFNKQTPLEAGELRDKIMEFSEKVGFRLKNIYVIDGSRRSTKANAYFTGIGSKKRIVLFDTLIQDLERNEIVAVLAHEIGHYKKKHTLTGLIISIVHTGLILFILSLFIGSPVLSEALGTGQSSFHIGLIAFSVLYSPISTVLGLGMNFMSRRHEYQADRYAGLRYEQGSLIGALKKLSGKNLSNLTPLPIYVFFHYSHPPLLQRIRALMK
jgi:STE24 endopeptidase